MLRELLPLLVAGLVPFAVLVLIVLGTAVNLVAWQPPILQTTLFGTAASQNGITAIASDPTGVYAAGFVGYSNVAPTYLFVNKYGLDGQQIWTQHFGNPNFSSIVSIAAGQGGVYAAGYLAISPLSGSQFLRKYDSNGNLLWDLNVSGPGAVAASTNYIYLVGGYNNTRSYIAKFDSSGNLVWTRLFGAIGDRMSVVGESSGIYVANANSSRSGYVYAYASNSTFLWTQTCSCEPMGITSDGIGVYVVGIVQTTSLAVPDGFLTKYDLNGNQLWTTKVAPPAGTEALVGAGELRASADSSGVYLTETTGDVRGTVMKYDSNGNHVWSLVLPWTTGISLLTPSDVIVVTAQQASLYVGGDTRTISNGVNDTAFIASISESSSLVFFGINPPNSFGLVGLLVAAAAMSILWLRRQQKRRVRPSLATSNYRLKKIPTDSFPSFIWE